MVVTINAGSLVFGDKQCTYNVILVAFRVCLIIFPMVT